MSRKQQCDERIQSLQKSYQAYLREENHLPSNNRNNVLEKSLTASDHFLHQLLHKIQRFEPNLDILCEESAVSSTSRDPSMSEALKNARAYVTIDEKKHQNIDTQSF